MNSDSRLSQRVNANPWERFAEIDPYLYIFTDMKRTDPKAFWQSGEQIVHTELLPLLYAHSLRPLLALELGSGVGRLVFPLARHFRSVVGVDIAKRMVHRAKSIARNNGVDNVSFISISDPEDCLQRARNFAGSCDLIYSLLVFQHISEFSIIEAYLHVIRALLHERGVAYLQFDTRPQDFGYRLKTKLPDFLLPRFWRRGIRRIRRSPSEIEAGVRRAGLEIVGEYSPHTAYHRYVLRLPSRLGDNK
jgi:cyclopropane fatty-acyl-phospholipid synthase-like methyltransferase